MQISALCTLNVFSKLHLRCFHNKRLISVGRHVLRHVEIATALIIYRPEPFYIMFAESGA